ncbi:unnamed protein product [Parascedosporium putredinis]|uniref:GPI ethanolamine phosphate transferase 2 n=1 Tax=Parascedosporium putredinis TaxID=1442378 RepID=A0A9P1GWU2_9PEZI|nr:unnamed protein product [Parascedosporium putredinis]CAI7988566.1 unnamed protein product [Parascedosporium putredinis]
MMTRFPVAGLVLCANVIIPIAILIFARGFFPYKPFIPGLAQYEKLEFDEVPSAPFDRLIFMVVDALRSDFVFAEESGFKYTQSLIRTGSAIPFTAYARSPTVTMPRLKAITTGSIPSFLDAILNVDEGDTTSSLAAQDTWLAQMKAKGTGNLVLYGDDTWLKLFPETFDRHDGTSSFFVADFTEVDHNVTRNVAGELKNVDWNTMILHYLGLDHIGHKSGPRSSNMFPKQQEMDGIVETFAELASVSTYEDISPQWIDKITEVRGLMRQRSYQFPSTPASYKLAAVNIAIFFRHTTLENCARFLTAMAATRLVRGWNQTGQKFAGEPDIVKSFMTTYPRFLWLIVMISYIWLQGRLMRRLNQIAPIWVSVPSVVALMWAAFSFKLAFTNEDSPELVVSPMSDLHAIMPGLALITRARLVFASATAITAYALFINLRGGRGAKPGFELLHYLYTVIALTQSRVTNIPLFLLHGVQFRFLQSTPLSVADIAVSSLLLQHMSYFAFGGTNAMSSVDLSSAYNGVSDFNAVAVGVLTFVSNWAAPIYWSFATARLLLQNGDKSRAPLKKRVGELQKKGVDEVEDEDETISPLTRYLAFLTAFVSWSVLFVMVACTVLRTHLFIWTVFSPKYLYCIAWGLGQHLGVNVTLGSLLFWLGTRSRGH